MIVYLCRDNQNSNVNIQLYIMVIQRLQTLYLLMAVAVTVVFLFVPFGFWDVSLPVSADKLNPLEAGKIIALLVPSVIGILLMLIAILCFKKLPLQKSLVALSALIVVAVMLVVVYIMVTPVEIEGVQAKVTPEWGGGGLLLVGTLVALFAAYRSIRHDQKLLRSYDRLR